MEAYSSFAEVYDLFMDNVPYEEWSRYIIELLREYDIADGIVADLGCGTGKLTRLLAAVGYDMIGVDSSEEMLGIARCHDWNGHDGDSCDSDILYLHQDMRQLELLEDVRAVISICDSMNYILEEKDLLEVFGRVREYLQPGGIFIFDLNTVYKYKYLLGETTIAETRDEGSFIWDNYFDEETGINEYDLTLFIREESGLYRKYEETHYQRAYDVGKIRCLLEESGLRLAAAYDAFTRQPVRADSERVYMIATLP